jgi:hypothetical protein
MTTTRPAPTTTAATSRLCATPPVAVSVPPQTHTYGAPGPYVVRAVATVYGCVFPQGPGVPNALPDMGVVPSLVETAVTYRHG